jgi:hypothetical protein
MNVRRRIWQIPIEHPAQQIIRPFEKALTVVQTDDSRPKKQIMDALLEGDHNFALTNDCRPFEVGVPTDDGRWS